MNDVHKNKSALGGAVKAGNEALAAEARTRLKESKAEAYIRRLVDEAPPISAEARTRLAVLLAPGTAA